jgi:hypothetical protein
MCCLGWGQIQSEKLYSKYEKPQCAYFLYICNYMTKMRMEPIKLVFPTHLVERWQIFDQPTTPMGVVSSLSYANQKTVETWKSGWWRFERSHHGGSATQRREIKVMGFRESHWPSKVRVQRILRTWCCLKLVEGDFKWLKGSVYAFCRRLWEAQVFSVSGWDFSCGKCFCPENAIGKTLHLSNHLTFCKCPNMRAIDFWNRIAKHVQYSMMISFMWRWHEGTLHIKCNGIERRHMKKCSTCRGYWCW